MNRKLALMTVSALPALLLLLSALTRQAAAAPVVVSPSPRPSLTPAASGDCQHKVFDNLEHLVIFRCPTGALAFYRLDRGAGRFHSWLTYSGWAFAAPGKVALDKTDDTGYQVLFGRASQDDVDSLKLAARTPPGKNGHWYHVILKGPGGATLTDDYFFIDF